MLKGLKTEQLIQVIYASSRDEIEKREIKAPEELKYRDLLVITCYYEDEQKVQNRKIVFKSLKKWLLS
ncbi:MAG: hypothetical protein QXE79_03415 [Candidatus Bathyarchaeia archaeon]